jgi:hypothetical protein
MHPAGFTVILFVIFLHPPTNSFLRTISRPSARHGNTEDGHTACRHSTPGTLWDPRYPANKRLCGSHSWSGCFGGGPFFPYLKSADCAARRLVFIRTNLCLLRRLPLLAYLWMTSNSFTLRSNQMHYFYYLKLKTIYNISLWNTTNCPLFFKIYPTCFTVNHDSGVGANENNHGTTAAQHT